MRRVHTGQPRAEREGAGGSGGSDLVGRQAEIALFDGGLTQARAGRGGALVVHGEAGIGKTCLLEHWALHAEQQGFLVLWASCWEGSGAPSYWPWREILRCCCARQLTALQDLEMFDAPRLSFAVGGEAAVSEDERFRLFTRLVTHLEKVSAEQPLVMMLDNLHVTDADSILLFEFVAREMHRLRALLIGTYRDSHGSRRPARQPMLARLGQHSQMVALGGLDREASEALLCRVWHDASRSPELPRPYASTATALYQASGGNPFLIKEMARAWCASGQSFSGDELPPIPLQVRELVHEHLIGLSPATIEVLAIAAVSGREFDARVVERAVGDAARSAAGLREAQAASVIAPVAGRLTIFAFAHTLVRETILSDYDEERQAQWHIRIAEGLVDTYDLTPERQRAQDATAIAQVAHHYFRAARHGAAWEATRYGALAAQDALDAHAFDQSVAQWQQALQALELLADASPESARQRGELLLGLGTALNAAGDRERARHTFLEAAEVARTEGDSELLARAAQGYGGEWLGFVELVRIEESYGAAAPPTRSLLQEALAGLPRRSPWRAVLQSRLAVELYFTAPLSERQQLAGEAVATARQQGSPAILGKVLSAAHVAAWSPDNAAERLALAAEIVDLGVATRQPQLEGAGRAYTVANLVEAGEHESVAVAVQELWHLAQQTQLPGLLWAVQVIESGRALCCGRFGEAESKARNARRAGSTVQQSALVAYSLQIVALRREQARLGELHDAFATWAELGARFPQVAIIHSALAWVRAELGDERAARRAVEHLAQTGFDRIERNNVWLQVMTELSEAVYLLQAREHAALLYDLLLPFAERTAVSLFCATTWGSVARSLGLLAALNGQHERAEQHFLAAIERNRAAGAWGWVAHSHYACARLLAESDAGSERAKLHLEEAQATAAELGMTLLQQRCRDVEAVLHADSRNVVQPGAAEIAGGAAGACLFRSRGEYWTLGFDGTIVRAKDTRGLSYIALLLRHPHRDIPALEVAGAGVGRIPPAESRDAALMLDPKARLAYQNRLKDLRESLAEAEELGNGDRIEAVRAEMEALAHELSRTTGLGGRDRRSGSAAERARINVNRAIAAAIKRIQAQHPQLGMYLKRTIKTGTTCTYKPGLDQLIDWQF